MGDWTLLQFSVDLVSKVIGPVKICVSIRWVTLWVRPPLCENMCVRSLGYIVGASPLLCVSIQLLTLWVHPPHVCVLSLEDNHRWILACCLLRYAAFLIVRFNQFFPFSF